MFTIDAELFLDAQCHLAEGPVWYNNQFIWVDIPSFAFHIWNSDTQEQQTVHVDDFVGTVVPTSDDRFILALKDNLVFFDPKTQERELIAETNPENQPTRFNDGKCDPQGRFWIGSMDMKCQAPLGSLYRLDEKLQLSPMIADVTISNGLAWNAASDTFYYIDTPTQKVVAYDFNPQTGALSNKRTAVEIPSEMGSPDGMTIDIEDNLWIALWGGYSVIKCDPRTGAILGKVSLPVPNVTSCCFGGKDLDTLYITTAGGKKKQSDDAKPDYAGGIFTVKPGVTGRPANVFKLN